MTTREEIEPAMNELRATLDELDRLAALNAETEDHDPSLPALVWKIEVAENAVIRIAKSMLSNHERDQQPPTREMFERLSLRKDEASLCWIADEQHPVLFLYDDEVDVDTIAKLRAACLLLGIETEGIL